ncbi:conjugal transfer protein TraX [Paenibacillus darwinianus]|uniref:Conjugal transfer protein TraX n=2 Tax=Paenibacillus darwinianus TaxID=1380763 RepID=A0A9W5S1A8_9BACL|nr:conjugal transfer protein TraX [Paenibacillus darwinianus]EXX88358.1 conjugal transfer protein TraX [Paenibacillus darwinianus]EXX88398.1 conjugal transfer protein TraX [Paenibacillus darwinianus]
MQWIAMITMLIDHVGLIFFPESEMFRIVGRIAFPLYSWFLVQGYIHTRNHKKYMVRLFWMACISQIPFTLALQASDLNVIFTLLVALIGLYAMDHVADQKYKALILIGVFVTAAAVPMDYGIYGVILIFMIRYFSGLKLIGLHLLLNLLYFLDNGPGYWIQLFSIAGTILIAYPVNYRAMNKTKWLYRSFYPAHLSILFVISYLMK